MMKSLIIVSLLAAAVTAAPALAQTPQAADDARAVPVRYADLNISETEDARALLSRLRLAAVRACEVNSVAQPGPSLRRQIEQCRAAALDEAVERANSPEATRLHNEQRQ